MVKAKELLFDADKWEEHDKIKAGIWKGKMIKPIIDFLASPKTELRVTAAKTIAEIILKAAETHQLEVYSLAAGYIDFSLQPK